MFKKLFALFFIVVLVGLTHGTFAQTEPLDLIPPTDANPHQIRRNEIVYATNRHNEKGDFDIWIMNADGSDQHKLLGDPEWDEIEADVSETGEYLAYTRCEINRHLPEFCEFHVLSYPELEPVASHNNVVPNGGIEWVVGNVVYSVQGPENLITRTFAGRSELEGMTDWPRAIHPAIDGDFLIAYELDEWTRTESGKMAINMTSPTIGAGDSEVLGTCEYPSGVTYLCTYHTIMQTFSSPQELKGSDFEMAFGGEGLTGENMLTGLVFRRDDRIWWVKYDLTGEICLTCDE